MRKRGHQEGSVADGAECCKMSSKKTESVPWINDLDDVKAGWRQESD